MGVSVVKNQTANAGDTGLIPGLEICLGEGNGNPLQYSCLGNPMDRRPWHATVHGVTNSQTQLNDWACTHALIPLFAVLWTVAPRLPCPWDFPGKNTAVGCHVLLQGIFPTQGLNPNFLCLLHQQVDSLPLSHLEFHCYGRLLP